MKAIYEILDWSEVWALLIPLLVLWKYSKQPPLFKPVIVYLWLGLIINILIDLAFKFSELVPAWMWPNNYLYNVHSIVRFVCFSSFFVLTAHPFLVKANRWIQGILFILLAGNFIFFENFFTPRTFSSRLLATEAGILLFYALQYYLFKLQEDNTSTKKPPEFWMVTGLSIYVVFNFPFFLLYTSLDVPDQVKWWYVHNISYIILCLFIAKSFYAANRRN